MFEEILQTPLSDFFYLWFLPFLITFVILFSILSALGIFKKKTNLIISLALTFAVAYSGIFSYFATYLFQLSGYVAVTIFIIIFIVGTLMWAFGRGKEIYYEHIPGKEKEKLIKERAKLLEKLREASGSKKREIIDKIEEIEKKLKYLR
jgi:CHASE2 domain-containing sensor protein